MKGVILCAGNGLRMQPFSYSLPKTLLPVANQTVLDYCVQKLLDADIREIGIVLNSEQSIIAQHLTKYDTNVQFQLILQNKPRGIADALRMARTFVGEDPFVLLLGDNLIFEPLETILSVFTGHEGAILLSHVENPWDYGIAHIDNQKIMKLEEKPKHPQSHLAITGMYVFTNVIFEAISQIHPSARGEFEITDAIQWMIDQDYSISYSITSKPFLDVGTIERWLKANEWMLQAQFGDQVSIGSNTQIENCMLKGPVIIGNNCNIKNAKIGPYVSIQDGCTLINCTLENCICLDETTIQDVKFTITDSVFGRDSVLQFNIEQDSRMRLILGDKSQVYVHGRTV
jgi:glucose-1-phosphate thymidylyltransferase